MGNIFNEFRRFEQTLRHLTMIAEQANEGIVVVDLNGITRFVNMAATKMHRYVTRNELVGKQINVFHTEEQMKNDVLPLIEEVKRRGQLVGPIEHVRSDGTVFPTETKMTLLKDERDKAVGLIVFVTDMTERRQAQEQLEEYRQQLEQRVKERTAELATANTSLQQEIAERRQAEQSLAQQASELTATNENLQQQVCEHRQTIDQLGQRLEDQKARLSTAEEKLQQQVCEHRQTIDQLGQRLENQKARLSTAEEKLQQQAAELAQANEQLKQQITEHNKLEEELLESIIEAETPTKKIPLFNPQELKALSELAKRLT